MNRRDSTRLALNIILGRFYSNEVDGLLEKTYQHGDNMSLDKKEELLYDWAVDYIAKILDEVKL